MSTLTFDELRAGNEKRCPLFKDAQGRQCHPEGVNDWALSQWSNALAGEVGEAANIIKKIERGDFTLEEARGALAKELADIQCYLDLLAARIGADLGQATIDKFNEVSVRVGVDVWL